MSYEGISVSIIIPVYNGEKFIAHTLKAVIQQAYSHFDCIIVDDGSTDGTKSVVNDLIKTDNRFFYIYQSNAGLSAARNKGLSYAKGHYIQFLDADDVILPLKLVKQIQKIKKVHQQNSLIVSYTDYLTGTSSNIYMPHAFYISPKFSTYNFVHELIQNWESSLCIPPNCFLFSATIFKEHQIRFDETLKNHEDFDCWLKILLLKPTVQYIDEKLCIYRITDSSMSKNMRQMGEGFLQVLNTHIQSKNYSKVELDLLLHKRRNVLQSYCRVDLMSTREKKLSINWITKFYIKRLAQKIGLYKYIGNST
jgi:glycosyltransferase involved in cell wall biosynthesis